MIVKEAQNLSLEPLHLADSQGTFKWISFKYIKCLGVFYATGYPLFEKCYAFKTRQFSSWLYSIGLEHRRLRYCTAALGHTWADAEREYTKLREDQKPSYWGPQRKRWGESRFLLTALGETIGILILCMQWAFLQYFHFDYPKIQSLFSARTSLPLLGSVSPHYKTAVARYFPIFCFWFRHGNTS